MERKTQAEKAMERAEERYKANDLEGAMRRALEAKVLFPSLSGLKQALAAYEVHVAAAKKGGGANWYAILGVDPSLDLQAIKKKFKEMCMMTHPDKNGSAAAEGAFKLVMQAWEAISRAHDHQSKDSSSQPPPTKPDDNENTEGHDHYSKPNADDDHGSEDRATDNTEGHDHYSKPNADDDHGSEDRATDNTDPPPTEPNTSNAADPRSTKKGDSGVYRVACPKCGKQCKRREISGHGFIRCKHASLSGEQEQKHEYYYVVIHDESIMYYTVDLGGGHCANTGYNTHGQANTRSSSSNWNRKSKNKQNHQNRETYGIP